MEMTPEAEELLTRLGAVAPAEDVAEVRVAATLEAARLRHEVVVPGHVITILVRGKADPGLLTELGVDADATPAQLLDRTKAEVDAAPRGVPAERTVETLLVTRRAPVEVAECPECGVDLHDNRRAETRRVPNPEGGRGSVMARVVLCGACGAMLGPG